MPTIDYINGNHGPMRHGRRAPKTIAHALTATFVKLLLQQAEQQAQVGENAKEFERRESGDPDQ